ncbi:MAG TPA: acyl carrier protein [Tepidisphaeraceae bacterium]
MPMSREEIFKKVQAVLVDALGVDEEEVTPTATLRGDLGAESIDFLDIVFRLEKTFNIKIPRNEMFPEEIFTNPQYVQNNKLTPAGMDELRKRMPHIDFAQLEKDPDINNIHFTVNTVVNYIESKVNGQ